MSPWHIYLCIWIISVDDWRVVCGNTSGWKTSSSHFPASLYHTLSATLVPNSQSQVLLCRVNCSNVNSGKILCTSLISRSLLMNVGADRLLHTRQNRCSAKKGQEIHSFLYGFSFHKLPWHVINNNKDPGEIKPVVSHYTELPGSRNLKGTA